LVAEIHIRARLGIVGDRYFNHPAHRDSAVTVIAQESLPSGVDLLAVRRNVLVRDIPIDTMVGSVLSLDSGDGPVRFQVERPANPCAWMDVTIAPGAWRALRGQGGVRCTPLDDGVLRVGPVTVSVW
jgi:MOSC domain-containing protein YiiM